MIMNYKLPDEPADQAFLGLTALGAVAAVGMIGYAAWKSVASKPEGAYAMRSFDERKVEHSWPLGPLSPVADESTAEQIREWERDSYEHRDTRGDLPVGRRRDVVSLMRKLVEAGGVLPMHLATGQEQLVTGQGSPLEGVVGLDWSNTPSYYLTQRGRELVKSTGFNSMQPVKALNISGSGGFPLPTLSRDDCNVCSGDVMHAECPLHGDYSFLTGDSVRAFADSNWVKHHNVDPGWLIKKSDLIDDDLPSRAKQARGAVWAAVQDARAGRL